MADILHEFPIAAPVARVFEAFTTPAGLDTWWTLRATGTPVIGAEYELFFGKDYDWRGVVRRCEANSAFEWELTTAMDEWRGTRVGADFSERGGLTWVRFYHRDWPDASEHFRVSSFCWAMYLRQLRRYVECGEAVPYEKRLEA
jgi:uncharacterized protein YndB with AHSA1/START domain